MPHYVSLAALLIDIEAELRQLQLWEANPPSAQALSSSEPFCVDTLAFTQWLQFIFLPRMHILVEQRMALPQNCAIAPMAEEYFKPLRYNSGALIALLAQVDQLLGGA